MLKKYPWRTGRYCQYKLFYHLIFVTKYRRKVFTVGMIKFLHSVFYDTCLQMQAELLEFNGEDDHVHLLISCNPKLSMSTLIGKLKGKSSYMLRKAYWDKLKNKLWGNHLWSPSYCAVTCGGAPLDIIKQYIQEQRIPTSAKSATISKRETKILIKQ